MDTPSVDPRTTMSVETLYRSHAAEIFRYAFAMLGNRADAEDVTQATFVNAMRAIERHGEPHTPSNWLITIAHNIVRQRFRQQQARPAEVELESEIEAAELEQGETSIDDLVRALQRIPPNQREALVMRELEGRPYREIAAMLELSLSAVETLIFRARRSLAEELEHLVTCERAELALTQRTDGRLSRKDRRRLEEHLRECPACAELAARQTRFQDAFKRLALLPAPVGLPSFTGGSGATLAAGAGAATVGAGATAVAGSTVAAGGSVALVGGAAAKLAVAAAAIAAASGVGYHVERTHHRAPRPVPARTTAEQHEQTAPSAAHRAATATPVQTTASVSRGRTVAETPAAAATAAEAPTTTAETAPPVVDHRSDRAQAVQEAHASGEQPPPSPSGQSAQGATQSAAAPGQVKKAEADATAATPPAKTTPGSTPKAPNPNADAAASKPKSVPAANANPNASVQGNEKPKNEPKSKQAASASPPTTATTTVTTTDATTTTAAPTSASPPPGQGQGSGQGNGNGKGSGKG